MSRVAEILLNSLRARRKSFGKLSGSDGLDTAAADGSCAAGRLMVLFSAQRLGCLNFGAMISKCTLELCGNCLDRK